MDQVTRPPFDPYRKWLGILPRDQPPHHYRLLGIELLESDPDVISNAADGRMAQIKNFQIGEHSRLSQQILNEIAAAKVCLLNPKKKAEYDQHLRQRLKSQGGPVPPLAPPVARKAELKPAGAAAKGETPELDSGAVVSYLSRRGRKEQPWWIPVAVGVAAGAVLLAALSMFLFGRGGGAPGAERTQPSELQPQDRATGDVPSPLPADDPAEAPQLPVVQPAEPQPQSGPTEPRQQTSDPQQAPAEQPALPEVIPAEAIPGADPSERPLADLIDPADPGQPADDGVDDPGTEQLASADPPPDEPAAAKRIAIPGKDERREAERQIREIFKREFSAARKPDEKLALAAKLLSRAKAASGDPTARFVLMRLACETAADAGELTETFGIVEQMRGRYEIDPLAVKAYLLGKVAAAARTDRQASAGNGQIATTAEQLADEAVLVDNFYLAGRLLKLAAAAARKMKDTSLVGRLRIRSREIDRLEARFSSVKKALEVFSETPNDPEANLTAGRWYCFTKGDWDKGLPMLAKAADTVLAGLAKRDMAGSKQPAEQTKLADDWWELSEKESKLTRPAFRERAACWYEQALPKLTGLEKLRVEKRLEAMAADAEPSVPRPGGVVQKGNVALAINGTVVVGASNGHLLLDGNTRKTGPGRYYAESPMPCDWTITFPKVYRLRTIRLLLLEEGNRQYKYVVQVSADGRSFKPLADRSQGLWTGWQEMTFTTRPVKAIKLIGLHNSVSKWFQAVEVEAYCFPPRGK